MENYYSARLEEYYATNDFNSFMNGISKYFGLDMCWDMEAESAPLEHYLRASKTEMFEGPFGIMPAHTAFDNGITIQDVEYELFNDFGLHKRMPLLKIGEDSRTDTTFWLILKKVIYGTPNGFVITTNRIKLGDEMLRYFLINKGLPQDYDSRSELIEFLQLYGRLNIKQLLEIQQMIHHNAGKDALITYLQSMPVFEGKDIYSQECLKFLREYI